MSLNDTYKQNFYRGQPAYGSCDMEDVLGDKIAEEILKPGDFITLGTAKNLVKKVSSANDVLLGMVPYRMQPVISSTDEGTIQFEPNSYVPYIKSGLKIRLTVDVNVSAGDAVYINVVTGNLTNDADGGDNLRLGKSFFEEDVLAGKFALVSFHVL